VREGGGTLNREGDTVALSTLQLCYMLVVFFYPLQVGVQMVVRFFIIENV
jgi:hypothetical protein